MAVQGVEDFLAILEKSRLVGPSGIQKIQNAVANAADASAVAKFLVQQGVLTRFQAGQLLAGRHMLQIGPYRLLDRIVSSGTGAVYAAQATPTKESLSLKTLPRKLLERPNVSARLQEEVDKLKSLDHPGLCQVREVVEEGEQTLLLAALAEGQGLGGRVAKEGPLPFDAVAKYVRQTADALAAAHERGVVHGDLTPNHLICDEQDRVKIVDMGTAGLNPAGANTDYAAPELSAQAPATPACDIYSLGCTLYFLITGKPPFPEGTAEEKRRQHREEMPAPVLQIRPDAPPELMKLCIRMMVKEPDRRIESCDVVAAAIDKWLASPPAPSDESAEDADDESADTPDADETDPEVDGALAAAMAAGQFDDQLDEPPPEVTPEPEPAAAGGSAPADPGSSDADDVLAQAMAASEFDHAIEDEDKAQQRTASLGEEIESPVDDDFMGELTVREEEEDAPVMPMAVDKAASASGGPKLFGLDIYRLLGVKEDDEPAAKKKKLIKAGAAGGILVVAGIVLLCIYVVIPMFSGKEDKRARLRKPRTQRPVAQANQQPPAGKTDDPAGDDKTGTEENGDTTESGDGDAADPESTGEATDPADDSTTEAGEENGEPPNDGMDPEPTDNGDTKPDDTKPDDTEPGDTEPGDTTDDVPAEPASPFAGLAASVDLPTEAGAGAVVLGPLQMPAEAECTATLIGAEQAGVRDVSFSLQKTDTPRADAAWYVQMTPSGAAPVTVGGFFLKEGELSYMWAGDRATDPSAQALKRLVLKLESGADVHVVALRPAQLAFPITADFQRGNMRALVDPDWLGDGQALFVEISALQGQFPVHAFKDGKRSFPAAGQSTFIQFGEGEDRTLAIKAESTLTPKVSLELIPFFKVECENKVLTFNQSSAILCGQRLHVNLGKKKTAIAAAQEREKRARTPSEAARQKKVIEDFEAEIAAIEKSLDDLKKNGAVAKAVHEKGKIHFRVFYKLGDHEIDLVRTEAPANDDAG